MRKKKCHLSLILQYNRKLRLILTIHRERGSLKAVCSLVYFSQNFIKKVKKRKKREWNQSLKDISYAAQLMLEIFKNGNLKLLYCMDVLQKSFEMVSFSFLTLVDIHIF